MAVNQSSLQQELESLQAEIRNFETEHRGDIDVQFAQLMKSVARFNSSVLNECRAAKQRRMIVELGYG